MSDTPVVRIDYRSLPSLGPLYAQALTTRKPGLRGDATVPAIEATANGVSSDIGRFDAYRRLCACADRDTLPIAWPHILAVPLKIGVVTARDFPLPLAGLIHVRHRIVQYMPLALQDNFDLACRVEGHRDAHNGVEVDLVTTARRDGVTVWQETMTALRRSGRPSAAGKGKGKGEGEGKGKDGPEVPVGDAPERLRSEIWRVAEDTGRRYAGVSGDWNPIHVHALLAKPFGFKRAIVHGMWSLARAAAGLVDLQPAAPVALEVSFRKPILLPGRVLFSAGPCDGGVGFHVISVDGRTMHLDGRMVALTT